MNEFALIFSISIVTTLIACIYDFCFFSKRYKKIEDDFNILMNKYGITYNEFVNMLDLRDKEILRLHNRISILEKGSNDVEN